MRISLSVWIILSERIHGGYLSWLLLLLVLTINWDIARMKSNRNMLVSATYDNRFDYMSFAIIYWYHWVHWWMGRLKVEGDMFKGYNLNWSELIEIHHRKYLDQNITLISHKLYPTPCVCIKYPSIHCYSAK